jgi:predicted DCC family thiol-disulfide oxidoreductase YuxK
MQSVILFDGVCNLCNGLVRFVIARDPGAQFAFASLQSVAASRLLDGRSEVVGGLDSLVLVEGDRVFTRSTAALRIAARLGFPWSLATGLIVVAPAVRDFFYTVVARNRYRWFGVRDECMAPTPDVVSRFLPIDSPAARPLR